MVGGKEQIGCEDATFSGEDGEAGVGDGRLGEADINAVFEEGVIWVCESAGA